MPRSCLPAYAGVLGLLILPALSPAPVRAHAIQSSLEHLHLPEFGSPRPQSSLQQASAGGERLRLESSFSTGQPVIAAAVRLVPPDGGTAVELGQTDAAGRLDFTLPKQARADWELQVDGGPGHRDYLELPGDSDRVAPAPGPAAELRHAGRQLGLLALLGSLGLGGLCLGRRRGS